MLRFFLWLPLLFLTCVSACLNPTGIGNGAGEIPASQITNLQANAGLPYLWLALVGAASDNIVANYETPIQFRYANVVGMNSYNVLTPYQPTALDIWGRGHRRYCAFASAEDRNAHEQIAGAYVFAYSIIRTMPETTEVISDIMENVLGLPMAYLNQIPTDEGTPWGLVKNMVDEMMDFLRTDGWNADGSLTNGANRMPYRDFDYTDTNGNTYSRYQPNPSRFNPAWSKTGTCLRTPEPWNWEPLLETNGFGFFSEQLHVTPFIGFTGKLLGVTEEEYESFSSPLPEYDWCAEADYALENTRVMASSDLEKMEIEFYDNKFFSLVRILHMTDGLTT